METMTIPFSSIDDDFKATPFAKIFMNRLALRKRLHNTRSSRVAFPSVVTVWEEADDDLVVITRFADTALGWVLIGSTIKGICFLGFANSGDRQVYSDLKRRFPSNLTEAGSNIFIDDAIKRLDNPEDDSSIRLHLKGTAFQISIWERLLLVPFGCLVTYADLGGSTKSARATGAAVGSNPVAYILPCHRVIRGDGSFDKFYWGKPLKEKLLAFEVLNSMSYIISKGIVNARILSTFSLN